MFLQSFPVFMFLSVGAIALFSFIAVASWSDARRKEREAYYKSETIKKIAESQGGGNAALEYLREESRLAARRAREGMKLGGMITAASGLGVMVFFRAIADKDDKGFFLVGVIPLLIGLALMAYAYLLAPKETEH